MYICISCKYSKEGQTPTIDHAFVEHQAELTKEAFIKANIEENKCILVFTPFVNHSLPYVAPNEHNITTLVMAIENMTQLYSPSLVGRPQFIRANEIQAKEKI